MASIKDIARLSGAAISTVSRVINNSGYVSEATRERVEKAIAELDYRPNAGARTMRSGRSNLIGLLVPSIKVDFFARLSHRLEKRLFALGYQTLICSTAEDSQHEAEYLSMLLAQQVDGVLAASVGGDEAAFAKLTDAGVPNVAIDRSLDGPKAVSVRADHFAGGQMAAEHLIELGHRKIAIVGAPGHSQSVRARVAGALAACKARGLDEPVVRLGSDHTVQSCAAQAREVFVGGARPTGIVGTSDIAAIGAMHAARALGLEIPRHLSVVGFDDTPLASYVFPALTTIAQPIDQIADAAIAALMGMIGKGGAVPDRDVVLPVALRQRESSGPAAAVIE